MMTTITNILLKSINADHNQYDTHTYVKYITT